MDHAPPTPPSAASRLEGSHGLPSQLPQKVSSSAPVLPPLFYSPLDLSLGTPLSHFLPSPPTSATSLVTAHSFGDLKPTASPSQSKTSTAMSTGIVMDSGSESLSVTQSTTDGLANKTEDMETDHGVRDDLGAKVDSVTETSSDPPSPMSCSSSTRSMSSTSSSSSSSSSSSLPYMPLNFATPPSTTVKSAPVDENKPSTPSVIDGHQEDDDQEEPCVQRPGFIFSHQSVYAAVLKDDYGGQSSSEVLIIPKSSFGLDWNEELFLKPHQRRQQHQTYHQQYQQHLERNPHHRHQHQYHYQVHYQQQQHHQQQLQQQYQSSSSQTREANQEQDSQSDPWMVHVHEIRLEDDTMTCGILPTF